MPKRPGLADHVQPGLQVLFVGINPGLRSAAVGHHFAGYSNRFWKLLFEARLVPLPLTYKDDWRLPEWGFGLTNVVARASSGMHDLTVQDYTAGRRQLATKIRRYQPRLVALLGVTLYSALFSSNKDKIPTISQAGRRTRRPLGLQPDTLAGVEVFLLPNPSGRNAHYSYREMLHAFRALRRHLSHDGTR